MHSDSSDIDLQPDDCLLKAWAASGCHRSFRLLVERHLGLVFGLAMRRLEDSVLARDVAQSVFIILARKAAKLPGDRPLALWLHRTSMIECSELLRRDKRRRDFMKDYASEAGTGRDSSPDPWREIRPHLDGAIHGLSEADRRVILLRFFERRSFREIGDLLGKSAAAAQKQGERAVERLGMRLRKREAAATSAALAAALTARVTQAAPEGLASIIASNATAAALSAAAAPSILNTIRNIMNIHLRTALITASIAAIPLLLQWRTNSQLNDKLSTAEKSVARQSIAGNPLFGNGNRKGTAGDRANGTASEKPGSAADWESALLEPDPLRRHQRISALIERISAAEAPGIKAAFDRLASGQRLTFDSEYLLFLRAWGRLDGSAAMAALKDADGNIPGNEKSCAVLAGWAAMDAAAARVFIEGVADPSRRAQLTYGLLDGWAATDFAAAAAYAASAPRSQERDRFRELLLARAMATGGVEAAQKFFSSIPADEHNQLYRQRAFDDVTRALMMRDPAVALQWLTRTEHSELLSPGVIAEAARLGASTPAQMLSWIDGLQSDARASQEAAAQVVSDWAGKDPAAAAQWMKDNSNHAGYDSMVNSMARSVALTDTEGGVAWANTIRDESLRQSALDSVIRKSLRRDPQGAAAQLAAMDIDQSRIDAAHERGGGSSGISFSVTGDQFFTASSAAGTGSGFMTLEGGAPDSVVWEKSTTSTKPDGQVETRIQKVVAAPGLISGDVGGARGASVLEIHGTGPSAAGGPSGGPTGIYGGFVLQDSGEE